MHIIIEKSWFDYGEVDDIILYCTKNNIKFDIFPKEELLNLPQFFSYIYFCSTDIVLQKLKEYNCEYLCPDTYDETFNEFYCRKIEKIRLNDINYTENIFIKPIENSKLFDGFIAKSQKSIDDIKYIDPNMIIYKSEIVNIVAEYRLLIGNGKIYGSTKMKGDDIKDYMDKINITKLIELTGFRFKCIDIGFISESEWVIVEINPMYSLDDYEMDITSYMNFCIDSCLWINENVTQVETYKCILQYWFPSEGFQKFWFYGKYNKAIDNDIRDKFLPHIKSYFHKKLDLVDSNLYHESILAQIILLDQFTRNIYRDIPIDPDLIPSSFINKLYKNLPHNTASDQEFIRMVIGYEALKLGKKYLDLIKNKNISPPFEHIVFALMPYRHSSLVENKQFVVNYLEKYKETCDVSNNKLFGKFENTSKRKLDEAITLSKI